MRFTPYENFYLWNKVEVAEIADRIGSLLTMIQGAFGKENVRQHQRDNETFRNPTIIILTDREDLDTQTCELFVTAKKDVRSIESRAALRAMLKNRPSGGVCGFTGTPIDATIIDSYMKKMVDAALKCTGIENIVGDFVDQLSDKLIELLRDLEDVKKSFEQLGEPHRRQSSA